MYAPLYFKIAKQYFQLSVNAFQEIKNTKQKKNKSHWDEKLCLLPTLFCFYHAIELLLKGHAIKNGQAIKSKHNILTIYTSNTDYFSKSFKRILDRYLILEKMSTDLSMFFTGNKINVEKYFELFKFPESITNKTFQHFIDIRLSEKFFEEVIFDVGLLLIRLNKLESNIFIPGNVRKQLHEKGYILL